MANTKVKDMIDKRFGKLVVLKKTDKRQNECVVWKCKCDCGNIVDVAGYKLRNGHTNSCGCYRLEQLRKKTIKDLTEQRFGRLVVLGITDKRNKSRSVMWECLCDCGNKTIVEGASLKNGLTKSCGCLNKDTIMDNNVMDTNIRIISHEEEKLYKNNTSGHKGVSGKGENWFAYCTFKGITFSIRCKTQQRAIEIRKIMRKERDVFLDWYNLLNEEQRKKEIEKYDGEKDYFKKMFIERVKDYLEKSSTSTI